LLLTIFLDHYGIQYLIVNKLVDDCWKCFTFSCSISPEFWCSFLEHKMRRYSKLNAFHKTSQVWICRLNCNVILLIIIYIFKHIIK
jgi:hypothetical protein